MTLEDRAEPHISSRRTAAPLPRHPSPVPPLGDSCPPTNPTRHGATGLPPADLASKSGLLPGASTPDGSRHGLTSLPTAAHHPSLSSSPPQPPPSRPGQTPRTTGPRPASKTSTSETTTGIRSSPGSLGKRSSEPDQHPAPPLESPTKKTRLVPPGSLSLPPPPQTPAGLAPTRPDLSSPLFFSSSYKRTSARRHGFAGSEVSSSVMSPAQESQDGGVTTLRLPKGQISAASPGRSAGTPGSWSSAEFSALSRSPDGWPQPSTVQLLQGIGAIEFLEQDERPTFLVDLSDPINFNPGPLHIVFANASLRATQGILELLQVDMAESGADDDYVRFKAWVVSLVREKAPADAGLPSISYGGITWSCSTLRKRFRFVCGNTGSVSSTPTSPSLAAASSLVTGQRARSPTVGRGPTAPREQSDYFGAVETTHERAHSEPRSRPEAVAGRLASPSSALAPLVLPAQLHTTFDWTRIPFDDPNLGAHHQFARSVDWASTSLGPVENWSTDLRIMSNMIMGSPHPAAMYWGPEYVAIYNEAYIGVAGMKHPQLMGSRYCDAWSEIWDGIQPVLDAAYTNGDATMKHDDTLFLTRHGFLEETFFNWAIIPLVGGDGTVVGLYNPAFENTRRKVNERRMLTLREVGVKTSQARDVKGFWSQVQKGLEYNPLDVPFALIYSVVEDSESEVSSMNSASYSSPPMVVLEGSLGVPDGHPIAAALIDLKSNDEAFAPYMRDSMTDPTGANPIILSRENGTLPDHLVQGLAWRGFGDPCRTVVVFPVHPTTAGETIVGFIVLGVNPRRPYDENYRLFVTLLDRQLATSMASVVLFEEEIKRGQRAARLAAIDRQELSMQLYIRTQEAVESEYRFTRMAEFGPVGLFIADSNGHINYCNEMWWKISGHARSTSTLDSWMESIRDEDRPEVERVWRQLVDGKTAVTHEFRFKHTRGLVDGRSVETWALMSAYPEKDDRGGLKSIFGCITDISQQKWAEDLQKQRWDEAVEVKRQQENFIDITSHEMRNPLSAILQCADEISSGLNRYKLLDTPSQASALGVLVDSCIEAANTISLCASHQKRIVDDILTLSKLDSKLLLVTPVDEQPVTVVQNVLKMFEPELNSNEISGGFQVEQSYRDLAVDWVKIDPSRLRQVLINLITNAIKFTQGRPTRSIVISLGASKDAVRNDISYIPPRHPDQADITDEADWAEGEKINLHLAVTDTGPGLDDDEKKILFQRFSQASPRTHVQYGGSGLGLFICRILTELQGGQIGVLSRKGEGSTFGFYIKSRKAEDPYLSLVSETRSPVVHVSSGPVQQTQHAAKPEVPAAPIGGPLLERVASVPFRDLNSARNLDILIVEDNLVNQRVLNRQLQLSGNNTWVANHGGEALQVIRSSRFWDGKAVARSAVPELYSASTTAPLPGGKENNLNISVILMDLEMPVMDGMSCTREIRRLEGEGIITHHIPIIAVTAYARPEQVEDAKAAGVDDVISKPFRIPELLPKIEELVQRYSTSP